MKARGLAAAILLVMSAGWAVVPADEIEPPTDWRDLGVALTAGREGSWDAVLAGAFSPCEAVRFRGRYLLYYVGASGLRDDGGPANRALGVAVSEDGRIFRKWAENPVLTRQGRGANRDEEGIFSCAALVDGDTLWLWYAGLVEAGPEAVNSHVMLARSGDGLRFEKLGTVISAHDGSVWNSGNELFPLGAWRDGDWHLLYGSKGRVGDWLVGRASGPRPDRLGRTGPALDMRPARVFGGGVVQRGLVPFIVGFENRNIIWFRINGDGLASTGFMERVPGMGQIALLEDGSRWLMYGRHRDGDAVRVLEAPAVGGGGE